MENSNNMGINQYSSSEVPSEIKKWNWGAFMMNIMWGIGNKSYLTLLCLIPLFNIIWIFVCGAKGNEWAWKNGNYSSPEEFFLVQNTWNRAGFVSFIITICILSVYILLAVVFAAAFIGSFNNY